MQSVEESPSWSQVPIGHASLLALVPAQYVPASQGAHSAGVRSVAGAVSTVPAGHAPCGRHSPWFCALVYVPDGHAAQVRSATGEPLAETYEPASHADHALHVAAFSATLKLPLGHATQVRSTSAAPSVKTRWPGTHDVCTMHAVAALPSSSHLPAGQAAFGASPPGQCVPGSHASHTASAVGVAA